MLAEPAGGDLVGRDAGPEVGPGGLPRLASRQERRRGAGVVAAAIAVRPALVTGQAAEHQEFVPERSQRLEDGGELEAGSLGRGRPVGHDGAVGHVEEGHPAGRPGRRRPRPANSASSPPGTAGPRPYRRPGAWSAWKSASRRSWLFPSRGSLLEWSAPDHPGDQSREPVIVFLQGLHDLVHSDNDHNTPGRGPGRRSAPSPSGSG